METNTTEAGSEAARPSAASDGWRALLALASRYRYPLIVIAAVGIVGAGQLIEDVTDGVVTLARPGLNLRRWSLIGLVAYELLMTAVIYRIVRDSVQSLRPVVKVGDEGFTAYERAVRVRDWSMDVMLAVASAFVVIFLFLVFGLQPLNDDPTREHLIALPTSTLPLAVVLAGYTVIGFAGLKLLYCSLRFGDLLGRLSRESLEINVFDTTPLLPFGNIALTIALTPAGIIAILFVGLGAPSTVLGWTVLVLASLASLAALLIPLWGIHRQMSDAKDAAMASVNARIEELYDIVRGPLPSKSTEAARVGAATTALVPMRKTIQEMTTWPFRDTVAFARAVLIAIAPLIYTTLSELIKIVIYGSNPTVP